MIVPPMPYCEDGKPYYEPDEIEKDPVLAAFQVSDREWLDDNIEVVRWLRKNHRVIREALSKVGYDHVVRERTLRLVEQPNSTTCGQACLAMLLGCTVKEAIELVGHSGITSDDDILRVLKSMVTKNVFDSLVFTPGPTPEYVVALQKHRDPKSDREHWTICEFGLTLDPAKIGSKLWPVSKHMVISAG